MKRVRIRAAAHVRESASRDARDSLSRTTDHRSDELVTQRNVLTVVLWMAGALVSFSATAVAVRALARTLALFEILALHNAAGIAILVALALPQPALRASFRPRRFVLHLTRNLIHFAATYGWALGVTLLPLATVFALEFTAPAWVALLAVLFLHERMTATRAASIGLGFAGVLVVLRPGLETLQAATSWCSPRRSASPRRRSRRRR